MKSCPLCQHDERDRVNELLVRPGANFREIGERFGLAPGAVARHAKKHLPLLLRKAAEAKEIFSAGKLGQILTEVYAKLCDTVAAAEGSRDFGLLLAANKELMRLVSVAARTAAELGVDAGSGRPLARGEITVLVRELYGLELADLSDRSSGAISQCALLPGRTMEIGQDPLPAGDPKPGPELLNGQQPGAPSSPARGTTSPIQPEALPPTAPVPPVEIVTCGNCGKVAEYPTNGTTRICPRCGKQPGALPKNVLERDPERDAAFREALQATSRATLRGEPDKTTVESWLRFRR